ncbi:ORFL5W_IRL [Human betaherpesvirus 5]|nr:ORFL5C [Human betaherpesvirus 5]QHX40293.1 ORFL5C_TRL [Human betaherpesvirus 5]QHX40679.1 ORFL5W_IRL [Human betaherpesvirus 5]
MSIRKGVPAPSTRLSRSSWRGPRSPYR